MLPNRPTTPESSAHPQDRWPALDSLARRMLLAGALAALGLLLHVGWLVWTGQSRLVTIGAIALFVAAPAAAAVGLLVASRMNQGVRIRLALALASAVASAYVLEIPLTWVARWRAPIPAMARVFEASDPAASAKALSRTAGATIDARPAAEVLRALQGSDPEAIEVATPSNHLIKTLPDGTVTSRIEIDGQEVMPMAGVSRRRTLLCNESGTWIDYQADRHGFNNPDAVWDGGQPTLAVLGDSFAHGYCVPREEGFAGRLQAIYPRTLNLGIAGDGPLLTLATMTEYAAALRPAIVLWCYFEGNDLSNLMSERRTAVLVRYMTEGFRQPALQHQDAVDQAILADGVRRREEAAEAAVVRRSVLLRASYMASAFVKLRALRTALGIAPIEARIIDASEDFNGANMTAFRNTLRTARSRVDGWGGRMYFVYLPDWSRYTSRHRPADDFKRAEVIGFARELGLQVVDLDPVFRASGDPLALFPFQSQGHYTAEGHRLVANAILKQLDADHVVAPVASRSVHGKQTTGPDARRRGKAL